MSKKSNDSIEEFFKKGVRKSDITFRESDWQKMERMLDEKSVADAASTSRPLKRIIGVVFILVLLSSVYFLIPGDDKKEASIKKEPIAAKSNDANIVLPSETGQQKAIDEKVVDENKNIDGANAVTAGSERISTGNQSVYSDDISSAKSTPGGEGSTSSSLRQQTTTEKGIATKYSNSSRTEAPSTKTIVEQPDSITKNKIEANTTLANTSNQKNITSTGADVLMPESAQSSPSQMPSSPMGETDIAQSDKKVTQGQSASESSMRTEQKRSDISENESGKTNSSLTRRGVGNAVIQEDSVQEETAEEKVEDATDKQRKTEDHNEDKTVTPSRWSVALVFAPEFSSTSFDKQTVPGSAYGLTIGYRIIDRLTISTGVLKTYKKYVGYGEDYQPPAGYWQFRTNGIVPDEVSGQCSVIEVPLMLQYDIMQKEKSRFFAAAGVSSYRMLNEAYAYTFNEPNDGAADGWSSDTPSSYYFSVGHLSLGYDRRLYRGLYLGVEPYVKIPFAGIGWSNVNLLTMGAYVNIRYRFSRRN